MCAFRLALYLGLVWGATWALSDKRLCIDPQCSELIAEGRTRLRYSSIEEGMLSFDRDEPVLIYSFGGGSRPELIGVEIRGRRGYVNADHVVETRRLKSPKLLLDLGDLRPLPTTTLSPFAIVDGTRIPLDLQNLATEAPPGDPVALTEPMNQSLEEEEEDEDAEDSVAAGDNLEALGAPIEEASPGPLAEVNLNQAPALEAIAAEPLNASLESTEAVSSEPLEEKVIQVPPPEVPAPIEGAPFLNQLLPAESHKSPLESTGEVSPEPLEEKVNQVPPPEAPIEDVPFVNQLLLPESPLESTEEVSPGPLEEKVNQVPPPEAPIEDVPFVNQLLLPESPLKSTEEVFPGPLEEKVTQVPLPEPAAEPLNDSSEAAAPIVNQPLKPLLESTKAAGPLEEVEPVPPPEATAPIEDVPPAEPLNSLFESTAVPSAEPLEEKVPLPELLNSSSEPTEIASLVEASTEEPVTLNSSESVAEEDQAGRDWLLERLGPEATCARENETQQLQLQLLGAFTSDMFLYLSTTALAVLVLIFVWVLMDKWRRAAPLIARINRLEQQLLATSKENEALQSEPAPQPDNRLLAQLHEEKLQLQAQLQALEKELDDSTEMGIELNRIIGEMLQSSDGSDILKANIEQMQRRLQEQQALIGGLQESQALKEEQLQAAQEQLQAQQGTANRQLQQDLAAQLQKMADLERELRTKTMQYEALKLSVEDPQQVAGSEARVQLQQLQADNRRCVEQLKQAREEHCNCPAQLQGLQLQLQQLRAQYEQSERDKVESCTKLTVLTSYFKEKEERMLKEISHYESLWSAKEGEATTTSQLSRHLQEELQNYKAQNDSLKQEIASQEVALKSQISLLEKQAHERWVSGRQAERKLEEARQEAAILRNRLTLSERSQLRVQSPLLQNGELALSPDPALSPPPPLAFLPRPFMLPPPADMGLPPPFMPGMFPGDHRPPPLGRMSSPPPVGGRYSPESTVYSEYERYERHSPYEAGWDSPYEREREYRRHAKGPAPSSGSDESRPGRQPHRKV